MKGQFFLLCMNKFVYIHIQFTFSSFFVADSPTTTYSSGQLLCIHSDKKIQLHSTDDDDDCKKSTFNKAGKGFRYFIYCEGQLFFLKFLMIIKFQYEKSTNSGTFLSCVYFNSYFIFNSI